MRAMSLYTLVVSLSNHEPDLPLVLRPFEALRVALSTVEGRQAQDERCTEPSYSAD